MEIEKTIKCKMCDYISADLTRHIKFVHHLDIKTYKLKYNTEIQSEYLRRNNSNNQKNGSSIYCVLYWIKKGFTEDEAKLKISEIQKKNNIERCKQHKPEWSQFNKEYWIKNKGFTEKDAIDKVKKIQSELSKRSSKFLGHKRSDEEKRKISISLINKINKIGKGNWASHFGKFSGRSKIEIECYNEIKKIKPTIECNISIGKYVVDMKDNNKIIEFYGDFWHANPVFFKKNDKINGFNYFNPKYVFAKDIWKKDKKRILELELMGYSSMIIWENDWKKDKEYQLELIKDFLYDIQENKN